ncbi:hypothetical protein JCM17960_12450 [Magnetospira thiophila]
MTPLSAAEQSPAHVQPLEASLPGPGGTEAAMFGDDGLTFGDFVDAINPLQHIPIVGTLYRQMTDDEIAPAPRVAGGTLFGGPIGLVVSLIDVLVENQTGKDMGEHAYALFTDPDEVPPEGDENAPQLAATETANAQMVASSSYAGVSDWARQEMAFRQEVAALQQKQRGAPLALAEASPVSPVRGLPVHPTTPAPRNEAGLGTQLFVQAMRSQPPQEALALAAVPPVRPAESAAASTSGPELAPAPVSSALEDRLQALAAQNPWEQQQQQQQQLADGWFAQSMMEGLNKYQTADGIAR